MRDLSELQSKNETLARPKLLVQKRYYFTGERERERERKVEEATNEGHRISSVKVRQRECKERRRDRLER